MNGHGFAMLMHYGHRIGGYRRIYENVQDSFMQNR